MLGSKPGFDLNRSAVYLSPYYMKKMGYAEFENVTVKEREFVSGGPMGPGENIKQPVSDITQVGESKITYVTSNVVNIKTRKIESVNEGPWSSISSVQYNINKPV